MNWGLAQREDGIMFVSRARDMIAIDASSHKPKWKHTVADLKNEPSLTSPVVSWDGSTTFVGQCACCYSGRYTCEAEGCFASVEAVNSESGAVMWVMKMVDFCPQVITATAGALMV